MRSIIITPPLRRSLLLAVLLIVLVGGGTATTNTTTTTTTTQAQAPATDADGNGNGDGEYLVGTGIYDMTGPAAQLNLMGYAEASQTAHGIHQRLRARAFIMSELPTTATTTTTSTASSSTGRTATSIGKAEDLRDSTQETEDKEKMNRLRQTLPPPPPPLLPLQESSPRPRKATIQAADPDKTVCFVSIDIGMGSDLLNQRVMKRLQELLPEPNDTDADDDADNNRPRLLCHLENLSISGTHTHSAPAGFLQYALFQITSLGFSEEVMHAYTEGVAQAIVRAHETLQQGSIATAQSYLVDANINRSPSSYVLNPPEERAAYEDQGDTDKTMQQLLFTSSVTDQPLGLLNWFAVHGTSMNSSNTLLSGDNKGYASYLMEKHYNGKATLPGQGPFVAAFASTNLGDVSPNTAGPRCIDTGLPCDFKTSTCGGMTQKCIAFGPGKDMFESTEIIGRKQYDHALELAVGTDPNEKLQGAIGYRHSFIDMSNLNVTLEDGQLVHTCPAALGYSFAGGTTDGPGQFDFTQGSNTSNCFWNMISGFLSTPTKEQIECHHPKPILLNSGRASLPYTWDPDRVPISIFQIGQFFILNVPAEFTTMAGRRLRKAVRQVLVDDGGFHNPIITIAGLANSYTHYVTTLEEYGGQRYEAASTLYGPHTLSAYIQEFKRIASDLIEGAPSMTCEAPPDLSRKQISLIPPVGLDLIGFGRKYGSVAVDANDQYRRGDKVGVSFRSANPRNNQRIEGTFLTVDRLNDDGSWTTLYVDGDWCTKFYWKGGLEHFDTSFAEIFWKIPTDATQGLHRICHFGTRKTLLAQVELALFTAPDWLTSNFFGSFALSMILQSVELAIAVSEHVRLLFDSVDGPRLKEFQGCSRTFLVKSDPGL